MIDMIFVGGTSDPTDSPTTTAGGTPGTTTPKGDVDAQFNGTAILGGLALAVFALVYVIVRFKGTGVLSTTFARTYALIAVAAFGILLAFSNVGTESRTAAFTLLGTVAGFLAGVKNTTTTQTTPTGGGPTVAETTEGL